MKGRVFVVFLMILFCLSGCSDQNRPAEAMIEEIIIYHGAYGQEADAEVDRLFRKLKSVDKTAALKWEKILDCWEASDTVFPISYGILPDGLADSGRLCLAALGYQLNADGSMKKELIERLEVVLASAEKYPYSCIVCTGGGTASGNQAVTEAGQMADWLKKKGISPERIFVEDQSLTTAQNAQNSLALIKEKCPQVSQIAVISSDYHIPAGALFFEACCILQAEDPDHPDIEVVSNAANPVPGKVLTQMFQAAGLVELTGDIETAYDIYYNAYEIPGLPQK